jgi:hypothetical protein
VACHNFHQERLDYQQLAVAGPVTAAQQVMPDESDRDDIYAVFGEFLQAVAASAGTTAIQAQTLYTMKLYCSFSRQAGFSWLRFVAIVTIPQQDACQRWLKAR